MDVKEKLQAIKEIALKAVTAEPTIINLAQIARVEKWYIEVESNIFAVGNKIIRLWWDNETEPLSAGEYEIEGQKMMVDSSGIITSITHEVTLKSNKLEKTELEELQTKLDLAVTEKDAISKELEALKLEAKEKIEKEEKVIELSAQEKTDKTLTELSATIVEMQKTIVEMAKKPVVEEKEKESINLSYAQRQVAEDNKTKS